MASSCFHLRTGVCAFAWVCLSVFAPALADGMPTNKWLAVGGGKWNDTANWSDPALLGQPFFADFSGLDAGAEGVTIGISTAKTKVFGLRFKGASDGWNRYVFAPADDMSETGFNQVLFEFHGDGGVNPVLDVPTCATVVFSGALNRCSEGASKCDRIEKTGGGMIHFDHDAATTVGPMWLRDGWLENFTSMSLRHFSLRIFPKGIFRLNENLRMGKLSFENPADINPIRLNGHRLTFGYGWQDQSFVGNAFTNDANAADAVSAVGSAAGSTVTFAGRQQTKLDLRLNDGDIRFASQQRPLVACFFNDAQSPGKNDGTLADLVAGAGTAQIVDDADRGKVLYLDGSTKLVGSDADGNLNGLPTGGGDCTISLWLKIAEDVTSNAGLLFWGTWSMSGRCFVLRCHGGFKDKQFMLSHYGDNFFMSDVSAAYDKAWHHLVIVRSGGKDRIYLDGHEACSHDSSPDITAGTFNLGYGQSAYFKGWIDDFTIFPVAVDPVLTMTETGIRSLADTVGFYDRGAVESEGHGTLHMDGARTIGVLTGASTAGRVRMAGDLTVGGTGAATATVYRAELVGTGDFIKRGADYSLELTGFSDYDGATRVEEGQLSVSDPSPVVRQTSGLVAEYTFEDASQVGRDTSGNRFDLRVLGSAQGVRVVNDETRGKVAEFGSLGTYLKSGATYPVAFPSNRAAYSVSAWVKPASDCPGAAIVWFWGNVTADKSGGGTVMRLDGEKGAMFSNWGNNYFIGENDGPKSLVDGQWHHAVMVFEGAPSVSNGRRRFYVDGRKLADGWASPAIETDGWPFYLGWRMNGGSNYYRGRMDDVRVYSFALSEEEAAAEFNGRKILSHNEKIAVTPAPLPLPVVRFDFEDADAPYKSVGGTAEMTLEPVGAPTVVADDQRAGKVLSLGDASVMSYLKATAIPDALPRGAGEKISISLWMRPKGGRNPGGSECAFYYGEPTAGFHLVGYNGDYVRYTIKSGGDLNLNEWCLRNLSVEKQWYHVVCTLDRANDGSAVFIDGVKITENVNVRGETLNPNYFYLGRKTSSDTEWFHGSLDDVAVYDRVLTDEEVAELYRLESGRPANRQLPPTTDLSIDAHATFAVKDGTDATIRSLTGAGTLELLPLASLTVSSNLAFSGTCTGSGRLSVGKDAVWTVPDDGAGHASPGTHTLLTAPSVTLKDLDLTAGRITPEAASGRFRLRVVDNGDGTSSVQAAVSAGMVILVR